MVIRYKLKFPLEGGELNPADISQMKSLWGMPLELQ